MDRHISGEKLPIVEEHDDDNITENGTTSIRKSNTTIELPSGASIKGLSEAEITEKLENILLERVNNGSRLACFQLGQLYFEQEQFENAARYFEKAAAKGDLQSKFQLGVLYYDGLGESQDCEKGFKLMLELPQDTSKEGRHLVRAAQYNVGRAYFQGFGTLQSDKEAEKYWLLAADDGNPNASVKAQSVLGMFYSLPDSLNLKKAFFWHSEATGNGSLESQGALGMMYLEGLGCKQNLESAFICLRHAAERGNVYAQGNLVAYYYKRKLFTKTLELAARVIQVDDIAAVAKETECEENFIRKGIAIACFYYGRQLHHGHGIQKDVNLAQEFYSKSYEYDEETCSLLQVAVQHGKI